jgi:hypothetical protein
MRKIAFFLPLALVATLALVSVANAQSIWNTTGSTITQGAAQGYYEIFGNSQGKGLNLATGNFNIANYYRNSTAARLNGIDSWQGTGEIGNYWVTTDTLPPGAGNNAHFSGNATAPGRVTVGTLNLQVGSRDVFAGNVFGSANETVSNVVLTESSVNGVENLNGVTPSNFAVTVTGNGTVSNFTQSGGTINNGGMISRLDYTSGTYNGSFGGGTGTIGTLSVAGNLSNNTGNWGNVDDLVFDSNGSGFLTISGSSEAGFTNVVNAARVDVTHGNILLDLTGFGYDAADWMSDFFSDFGTEHGISLASFFGGATINGDPDADFWGLYSFGVNYGGADPFYLWDEFGFATGVNFVDGFITYDAVPAPATLVIFGLGLAGLGIARARRRK